MSETVTAVQPDKAAMEKINLYTRRAYKPEEVYTFSVVLCDNEVDGTVSALRKRHSRSLRSCLSARRAF